LPIAGSGTLGAEIALANVVEAGDNVLAVTGGYFGDRLAEVAATLGAKVDKIEVPWGSAPNLDEVERKLSSTNYKAMLAVHVDTSSGVANPARELAGLARKRGALFVLDTVCSMAGMDVQVDNWGIDVCFTGSQKALAVPSGLAIVSFSKNALKVRNERKTPIRTYYGDITRWIPNLEDPTKYFATQAVNLIYALNASCNMILAEGLETRFRRHAKVAKAFRMAMRAAGLRILCPEEVAANTLTVTYYPENVNDATFRKTMAEKYEVIVAGALGPIKGKAFRVGHMGNVDANDILSTVAAIEGSLALQGYKFKEGSGVAAANQVLRE
jgi:alanine-glyoxylate transaminase/serine-glyoxylate transaminase/serine-pyruvate transaminase